MSFLIKDIKNNNNLPLLLSYLDDEIKNKIIEEKEKENLPNELWCIITHYLVKIKVEHKNLLNYLNEYLTGESRQILYTIDCIDVGMVFLLMSGKPYGFDDIPQLVCILRTLEVNGNTVNVGGCDLFIGVVDDNIDDYSIKCGCLIDEPKLKKEIIVHEKFGLNYFNNNIVNMMDKKTRICEVSIMPSICPLALYQTTGIVLNFKKKINKITVMMGVLCNDMYKVNERIYFKDFMYYNWEIYRI